jgi:hypothetical protein
MIATARSAHAFIAIFLAGSALAACSAQPAAPRQTIGAPMSRPAIASRRYAAPTATRPLIYAGSPSPCNCIRVFDEQTGALVGLITDSLSAPAGLATDNSGNLYVVNPDNTDITVYPPGMTTPSLVLTTTQSIPAAVAVADDGTVYVSIFGQTAAVFVYANGATTPTSMLFDGNAAQGAGIGIDKRGNVYWGFVAANGKGQIDEFVHGAGRPINTGLILTLVPIAVAFDKRDHMVVSEASRIDIVALPHTIIRTIATTAGSYGIALNNVGYLFVADKDASQIDVYAYPQGVLTRTIATPNFKPFGLALAPRLQI